MSSQSHQLSQCTLLMTDHTVGPVSVHLASKFHWWSQWRGLTQKLFRHMHIQYVHV